MIPPFNFTQVIVNPWVQQSSLWGWVVLMGGLVATPCALLGCFLVLRRLALIGDAISHAVLPGLVVAYLFSGNLTGGAVGLGALVAGVLSTVMIESLHRRSRVKPDAAMGIVLTGLFALGVVLLSLYADSAHLDADCVLFGDIAYIPLQERWQNLIPLPVLQMGLVALGITFACWAYYRPLVVTSFDPTLAASMGVSATLVHYSLMTAVSMTVVSAFEAVGAILVVAMMVLPAATAFLCAKRLPTMLALAVVHGWLSALLGLHLAIWLNCAVAAAMVVAGFALFVFALFVGPCHGLIPRWQRSTQLISMSKKEQNV